MKLKLPILLILLLITSTYSMAQCWSQVWGDDFNGTTLNTADWNYETGNGCPSLCGWGNNEKEYYTNSTSNVSVSGGNLNITGKYSANYAGSGYNFTSGKINTKNKQTFKYGRFEARMKLPAGTGTWPAFWMLPQSNAYGGWPTSGEIDIMENRGDQINKIGGTLHYGNAYPNDQYDGTSYTLPSGDFTSAFHIFAAEWDASQIRFYVDGVLYKTETKSPNSLNPASNNAVTWPWDQDFYVILNLAIGGNYTGSPSDAAVSGGNTSWNVTMLVDYVKVYTDLSGGALIGTIAGETSVSINESNAIYSIPSTSGATYAWTVTSGTISSGQGTDSIKVNWGSTSGSVSVTKTLGCGSASYNLPVTVMPAYCGTMLEDFENIRPVNNYGYMNGQLTQKVANPGSSAENTSPLCGKYIRNSSVQYDVLIIMNPNVGNADLIKNSSKHFMMDVYSNGAGRTVQITLENSSMNSGAYPAGRHSYYIATTTKVNQWETLTFNWAGTPDPTVTGTSVDQLTMLFMSNSLTGDTYYFDNLLLNQDPLSGTLSGATTVCNNQANVNYSITSNTGYTYNWTVPSDAAIISGQGTNSIQTTFGTSGGTISVTSTTSLGCTGAATTQTVTNNFCPSTGTTEADLANNTTIFPNPAAENLNIKLNNLEGLVKIQIMESTGKIISDTEYPAFSGNELSVPVSALNTGYYLIRITNGNYSSVKGFFKK
jgi:beta-glucanase (GH16 family)